jgi:hypothetical protein
MSYSLRQKDTFYLAGPMTGLPNFGYDAFEEAMQRLRGLGLSVISPHEKYYHETEEERGSRTWQFYMTEATLLLTRADRICLLPGWSNSHGARRELELATALRYPIYYYRPKLKRLPIMEIK